MSDESLNPKQRGLGRGLDAIFGEDAPQEPVQDENVSRETADDNNDSDNMSANEIISDDLKRRILPIEWLEPCSFQPRKHFNPEALEDLAKSIAMHGILQPIVVRPKDDAENKYEIIAGERRWRASQMVQLHEVPVVLQYLDDESVLEIALIENLQREDLTPIEEAQALHDLMDRHGHTQEKLSVTIGKSRSYIANSLRLITLPDSVQAMVNEGTISAGHARALVGLDNAAELAQKIVNEGLSVRAVEKLVKLSKNDGESTQKSSEKPKKQEKSVNTVALEEEMTRILGMNVTIDDKNNGKGRVLIDYLSLDQLDDILHRLSKH